jgi:hypothetical protein
MVVVTLSALVAVVNLPLVRNLRRTYVETQSRIRMFVFCLLDWTFELLERHRRFLFVTTTTVPHASSFPILVFEVPGQESKWTFRRLRLR